VNDHPPGFLRRRQKEVHVLELREVRGDFVARMQEPLLDQHHRRHAEHRLRRGSHAKDRIFLHRPAALDIHQAMGLEVDHLPAPSHHRDRPLDLSRINVPLHHGIDLEQALTRHPSAGSAVVASVAIAARRPFLNNPPIPIIGTAGGHRPEQGWAHPR
jgi:hypothetical protein